MDPLINGLFKDFRQSNELVHMDDSDAFELFAATLILRDDLLDQVEMTDLLLDKDTIGIDIALLEINGELVADEGDVDEVCTGKSSISVALTLMQVKTSTTVDSKEILNFGDTVKKVLSNKVSDVYPKLRAISQALFRVYDGYASKLKERPRINLAYVSTANDAALEDSNVRDRVGTVRTDLRSLPYVGELTFDLYGATRVYEASRRKLQANETEILLEKAVNLPKMPGMTKPFSASYRSASCLS